jgi:hypothetical protein
VPINVPSAILTVTGTVLPDPGYNQFFYGGTFIGPYSGGFESGCTTSSTVCTVDVSVTPNALGLNPGTLILSATEVGPGLPSQTFPTITVTLRGLSRGRRPCGGSCAPFKRSEGVVS